MKLIGIIFLALIFLVLLAFTIGFGLAIITLRAQWQGFRVLVARRMAEESSQSACHFLISPAR